MCLDENAQRTSGKGMITIRMHVGSHLIPPSHFTGERIDGQGSEVTSLQEISCRDASRHPIFYSQSVCDSILALLSWDFIHYSIQDVYGEEAFFVHRSFLRFFFPRGRKI